MKPIHLEINGQRVALVRSVRTRHEHGNGGYNYTYGSVPDGENVGDIVIDIDLPGIVRDMGAKALKAASKQCRDGFVVVRARNVRRIGGGRE